MYVEEKKNKKKESSHYPSDSRQSFKDYSCSLTAKIVHIQVTSQRYYGKISNSKINLKIYNHECHNDMA